MDFPKELMFMIFEWKLNMEMRDAFETCRERVGELMRFDTYERKVVTEFGCMLYFVDCLDYTWEYHDCVDGTRALIQTNVSYSFYDQIAWRPDGAFIRTYDLHF